MKTGVLPLLLALATTICAAPVPEPTPPGIPTPTAAKTKLAGLYVADPVDDGNYDRSAFKTWSIIYGKCNTRAVVLMRDGTDVQTNERCTVTTGNWTSPYDGVTFDTGRDLDIDHFIPLKNAWTSGAAAWTDEQREAFANDLERPQLWAVSAHSNRSKGDKGPEKWKPPLQSFYCTYAGSWVEVKSYYNLTINAGEKAALTDMLSAC